MKTKAVCIIASPSAVFDGDVIFLNDKKFGSEIVIYCHAPNYGFCTKAGLRVYAGGVPPKLKEFKLAMLWFWHMVILRKSHVYLTGILR